MVWGETLPTGRERAIETLIDMEPQGSFYRAARVLEEAFPQALLHRPNLVTKAALVEQAYSLSKHDLDQVHKYDAVFGESHNACFSGRQAQVGREQKDRILRHHAKIMAAKHGSAPPRTSSPSPQLVAALRHVYGGPELEGEASQQPPSTATAPLLTQQQPQQQQHQFILRSLLKSVMSHPVFAKDDDTILATETSTATSSATSDDDMQVASAPVASQQLETLISNVCQISNDSMLNGLLIAILSLLAEEREEKDLVAKGKTRHHNRHKESDPIPMPALQVGALLSTLKPDEDDRSTWNLDSDLLDYLGKAAAAYEERLEIRKARILARLEEKEKLNTHDAPTEAKAVVATPSEQPEVMTPHESTDAIAAAIIPDESEDGDVAATAALSAAVFEQIISAATGDETSSNEDAAGDSSDSDSDDDRESETGYDQSNLQALDENESSSSSSSSDAEPGDDEQVESDEDDDDIVLRQALALSLAEESQIHGLRVDTAAAIEESNVVIPDSTNSSCPVSPGTETPVSLREPAATVGLDESPLPPMPAPPKYYPYASMLKSNGDSDDESTSPYLDPSALAQFGSLPTSQILVHLLRYCVMVIEQRKFHESSDDKPSHFNDGCPTSTISGGIGCALFLPNHAFLKSQKSSFEQVPDVDVSLQLLVSLLLVIVDKRNSAMKNLRKAVAQENRTLQDGDEADAGQDNAGSGTPLSSSEGDDPAIALALNYIDDEAYESAESLEAKGMRRKAAAAAHDAAVLLKSLKRRTDSWKQRVKLYSHCTLIVMKSLRLFLQSVVRRSLQHRGEWFVADCQSFLPAPVISKLSVVLASLTSVSSYSSLASVSAGNEQSESEELFSPLQLYQGAISLWSECVPLVYPSVGAQVEVLRSLLTKCSAAKPGVHYRSLENLGSVPVSDTEPHFHRLQMLCRRLRVSDLLDGFVSSPACYLPEVSTDDENESEVRSAGIVSQEPQCASSVISFIASSSKSLGGLRELQYLYLALCHRCHVRVLLWDGLFACTEQDTEEGAVSLASSPCDLVRVGANPSSTLQFDATKCSDSIAILSNQLDTAASATTPNGSSVHQRASKVWGTVLSSTCYSPKTGVHRWAVRLDKCERGHVFVGVATAQASMRTYVGGDKYGWGMIGTQALWHDRRKIRGDYGSTFRTGSTIIVTLDTDAGTLSFSSWKDSSSSTSFSLDPLMQNLSTPRRYGHVGGTIEDWGAAFEGLPLDSRLYPAVGLYQRDDRVTLLTVESGGRATSRDSSIEMSGGLCYYPRLPSSKEEQLAMTQISNVRKFNDLLSWDGIQYVSNALEHVVNCVRDADDEFLLTSLLPSLSASLCLVPPTIPVLSERFALTLLPKLTKSLIELERFRGERQMTHRIFRSGLQEGKWIIRATGSSGSSSDAEEYVVDFSVVTNEQGSAIGFDGTGVGTTGKSKNGLVAIFGTVKGSSLHFVEEWTDGSDEGFSSAASDDTASSCVVTARLSLDGTKFEGTYRNVQFGTTGQIAGLLCSESTTVPKFRLKDAPPTSKQSSELASAVVAGEALLSLAHSHVATIVGDDAAGDNSVLPQKPSDSPLTGAEWTAQKAAIKRCLSSPFMSRLSQETNSQMLTKHVEALRDFYAPPPNVKLEGDVDHLPLLNFAYFQEHVGSKTDSNELGSNDATIQKIVEQLDDKVCAVSGGKGSLSVLSPIAYLGARRRLVCAFVYHCNLVDDLKESVNKTVSDPVIDVWRASLRIVEDGVRQALSCSKAAATRRDQCAKLCDLFGKIAVFLLRLEKPAGCDFSVEVAARDFSSFFKLVKCEGDLECLLDEMVLSSKRALLRLISLQEMISLLSDASGRIVIESPVAIESLAVGIPRLLGRGYSERVRKQQDDQRVVQIEDLGGHYLSSLTGCAAILRNALRQCAHRLFHTLGRVTERAMSRRSNSNSSESLISIDSMVLSLLASFTTVLRPDDVEEVVFNSGILSVIPRVLDQHRDSILSMPSSTESYEDEKTSVVRDLHIISQREISRSVLRAAVAVGHVLIYQACNLLKPEGTIPSTSKYIGLCLDLLINELGITLPRIEDALKATFAEYQTKNSKIQWEKWSEISMKTEAPSTPTSSRQKTRHHRVGKSGLNYLREHGMMQPTALQVSAQKSSSRSRGGSHSSSRAGTESIIKLQGNFCHQYWSHWLHILVAVSRVSTSLSIMANDRRWLKLMLHSVGLKVELGPNGGLVVVGLRQQEDGLLPGRYRARVLRLMLPLLTLVEPCQQIVGGLFRLAGVTSLIVSQSMDEDESVVSRETVSLLRHLHSPSRAAWRACVNQAITSGLAYSADDNEALQSKAGVLCFFNGSVDTIGRGSYVLLKPAAAVPLSVDQQSTPSGKGHSSSVGGGSSSGLGSTPHHVVGNGTEGIVAGLCRDEAAAGIVSSIDLKNGICEVILLTRNRFEPEALGNFEPSQRSRPPPSGGKGSSSSRHTLTVRALRSPLSDIVQAQEVPMYLDESIPTNVLMVDVLENALKSLSRSTFLRKVSVSLKSETKEVTDSNADFDGIKSEVVEIGLAVHALRSSIALFSDEETLSCFLQKDASRRILSELLRWASSDETLLGDGVCFPQAIQKKFLSSLPVHEARFSHLVWLLRDLCFRMQVMDETSREDWNMRLVEYRSNRAEAKASSEGTVTSNVGLAGYRTPPVGTVPDTPPILATGAAVESSSNQNQESGSNRSLSQSAGGSENSEGDEDDDSEAAATAAAHLREAAIAQMAELGLPRSWSELALRRTGGTNIEAAVHFCLERGGEMERLLAEERERERMMQRQSSGGTSGRRRGNRAESGTSNHLLRQLLEMGFPSRWCAEALAATGNNVDEALTWILTNGERLSAEDEGMEDDDDEEEIDEDEEDSQDDEDETLDGRSAGAAGRAKNEDSMNSEADDVAPADAKESQEPAPSPSDDSPGWTGSVIPLRFLSGRSIIDPKTLAVSGLPTGGFSSVGTKGVLLTAGKWYYEAILETAGCLQIGWADGSFAGHCHADRGDGCGDGPSSWAYDGWRRYRWHATATEWGCRWKEGDVVGCLVDMDDRIVSFTLNGRGEEIGMGVAFSGNGFRPCGGVYACVSFNRRERLRLILGGNGSEPFKYEPPPGYHGVGKAVLDAVKERDLLIAREDPLYEASNCSTNSKSHDAEPSKAKDESKRFLCDFSDGEHGHELMAWAHRYYGSDASVHLGSGRMKQYSGMQKGSSGLTSMDASSATCLNRRIEKAWSKLCEKETCASEESKSHEDSYLSQMNRGYQDVAQRISGEIFSECITMASLLARKVILHVIVTAGENFDPKCCFSIDQPVSRSALRLWKTVEASASLRCAGWVGEAGAMAISAEALGLAISSNDHMNSRHSMSERSGVASISDLDEGVLVPAGGITQVLSSVLELNIETAARPTGTSLAASSEAAIGSDGGGGVLVFLLKGIQAAVYKSAPLRKVILAAIRRSVRLLAVVEYDGDDSASAETTDEDDDIERSTSFLERTSGSRRDDESDELDISSHPDARLASFFTGLLLSKPVESTVDDFEEIQIELFEAWSIGMLSASLPWRMVCAFTAAGILNRCPRALPLVVDSFPTLARFYGRLQSTVARRVWAERAAVPVCSRYVQSLIELLASVKRAVAGASLPSTFLTSWRALSVDAATPLPLAMKSNPASWEAEEGWISSDAGWEIWTGTVEYLPVDWKTPSCSAVRTLMDGGDGPPMLREGCTVMRGLDWDEGSNNGNEDGKHVYEAEKAKREADKRNADDASKDDGGTETAPNSGSADSMPSPFDAMDPSEDARDDPAESTASSPSAPSCVESAAGNDPVSSKKKKKKKAPSPKLPLGTVLSVEEWNGIPAMGRRVRWHLTGEEGVYRYGGDGGRYDISHVEVNEKATRVRKRHPLPESAEQCAARHGFGVGKRHSIMLRLRRCGSEGAVDGEKEHHRRGILEWPDFGSGVIVDCSLLSDGSVTLTERELAYGSKDSGWEARFGQPSFVPGTVFVLSPTGASSLMNQADMDTRSPFQSLYEELLGSSSYVPETLRNRADGSKLRVTSEMRLFRGRSGCVPKVQPSSSIQAPLPPPINFDRDYHASSLSLSRDGRTVSCVSSDGRGTAFASVGFTKGVHYWEVKLEQADIGSVFIGVAEKPTGSGGSGSSFGYDNPPRLNRWHGWGFVNFRATYTAGAERVYGAHCHAGDTVGVLLDCDAGRISFFFDGLKYGEHILNDLGCAFENISPFGFNVDGCGSGGAGQGAPSGVEGGRGGRYPAQGAVRPRALWPVVGLRNHGDRVTISSKWVTSYGVDGVDTVKNALAVDELLHCYSQKKECTASAGNRRGWLPKWFICEAFSEYQRWHSGSWIRSVTRGSGPYKLTSFGLDLDFDASPIACASASAMLGLKSALLAGDRVRLKRSAGRMLELAEEAIVLGAYQGRLFYRIVSQKSEGGSLTEGGGRAWCWDESEVVDGLTPISSAKGLDIDLPMMDRFKCTSPGGLKIVYEGGAVVRSDLEIFDGSVNLGLIPVNTVIPRSDVLERRVNSCGVVRYRVRFEQVGEGWISSRIRGGKEEAIVVPVESDGALAETEGSDESFTTPYQCALRWYKVYQEKVSKNESNDDSQALNPEMEISNIEVFEDLFEQGVIPGRSIIESDSILTSAIGSIGDFSEGGDALDVTFQEVASAMSFALASSTGQSISKSNGSPGANHAAASAFAGVGTSLPRLITIMARVAVIRAFNRRARLALPWLPLRPCQEGAAILGGVYGHGASIVRAGRSRLLASRAQWVQVPSIAGNIRAFRSLFFTSVKRGFLQSVTEATTTPTPLSHDEYELPREIRTVRINRLKARRAMEGSEMAAKRKHSVFAQLHNETKGWGGAALRRGFVAKGHGGQKRAFKVKLIGEGVNDYSGPYREAFTDAISEIYNLDDNGRGSLGVFDPSPNKFSDTGENRDYFMFSLNGRDLSTITKASTQTSLEERRIRQSFSSLTTARDETSREVEEALVFLGRITGTAFRHGISVDLPLPLQTVWKAIVEELGTDDECLRELDSLASRQRVDPDSVHPLLLWQQRMLNSFVEGLSNVLPVEILTILSGSELRDILCGNPEVDVDLLRRVVEYEGYTESDAVIGFFWETLRELTNEERKTFLQFVWARNRLPLKESDFDAPFKIQRDSKSSGDQALPSASTCFFSLALPEYSSKEILKDKLLFAIKNVTTMETDFQTNSAEIAEGYRAF